jgi:hypothetical protein
MIDTVPILVVSCDAYADVWRPFFTLFFRHWGDRSYPVYLGSNTLTFDDPRVTTIAVGPDRGWADGVTAMLDQLSSEHVILLLEDFFIERDADMTMIRQLCELAQRRPEIASIRLSPLPAPSEVSGASFDEHPDLLLVVPRGSSYRISAQPAVWRVDAVRRFLRRGFTAWDFEQYGTQMSEYSGDVFLGPVRPALVYEHVVEKGRWREAAVRICREHGIDLDVAARGVVTAEELASLVSRGTRDNAMAASKAEAIDSFRRANRRRGLSAVHHFRRHGGSGLHAFVLAVFGLTGPRSVRAMQKVVLAWKIRRAAQTSRANARNRAS